VNSQAVTKIEENPKKAFNFSSLPKETNSSILALPPAARFRAARYALSPATGLLLFD
jgi:hypothetical protein